jgi:hypothetical protein
MTSNVLSLLSSRVSAVRRTICLILVVVIGWLVAGTTASAASGTPQPAPPHTPASHEVLAGLRSGSR